MTRLPTRPEDAPPVVVYKIGGSLLRRDDLRERLSTWLAGESRRVLLVVGGGASTDVVRDWDDRHVLGDATAHDVALASMEATAALVASLLRRGGLCATRAEATEHWNRDEPAVLRVRDFLAAEERGLAETERLPRTWQTTSDAIAAWVATRWPADELVLIKSCPPPAPASRAENASRAIDWRAAAAAGFVDAILPTLAPDLVISWRDGTASRDTDRPATDARVAPRHAPRCSESS